MRDIKISVIIPAYNVENYIEKCLNSIVNQTLKDIEIICVDDGSTDNTGELLRKYAVEDNRITLISQKNNGVAAARNIGLDAACGEYIMFLDGDDYYLPDTCLTAYDKISKSSADIGVYGNYNSINNELVTGWTSLKLNEYADGDYFNFQVYVWDKIYRRDYIIENGIRFVDGLKTAEDVLFCLSSYFKNPKYVLIDEPLYVYCVDRSDSATNDLKCIANDIRALEILHKMPEFQQQSLEMKLRIVANFCGSAIGYLKKFNQSSVLHQEIFKDIDNLIGFLNKNYSKKDLNTIKSYKKLRHSRRDVLLRKIFSVTNTSDKKYKFITFIGLTWRIRRVRIV